MENSNKKKEQRDLIINMQGKGYVDYSDKVILWNTYEDIFGVYKGNRNCGDCIREAIQKIIIETSI